MKNIISLVLLLATINLIFAQTQISDKLPNTNIAKYRTGCLAEAISISSTLLLTAGISALTWEGDFFSGGTNIWGDILGGTVFCIGAIGTISAPAYGVYRIGQRHNENGSFWAALAGSGIGLITGLVIPLSLTLYPYFKNYDHDVPSYVVPLYIIPLLSFPAGAVIGYNLSKPKPKSQGFLNHLEPPSLGIRPEKTEDGKTITALDFKLINARF